MLENAPIVPASEQGPHTIREARAQQVKIMALKMRRNTSAMIGLILLVLIFSAAIFAPWIATHDYTAQDLGNRLALPSVTHWLGTDELGRDIYSRVLYGGRITLYIACLTVLIAAPVGLAVGVISGYFGGWIDMILMRITDIFLALPSLILALAFVAALGPGIENAVIAISLASWPPIARLARTETMMIRKADYIAAVRLQGATSWHILLHHIVPTCMPSVIVRVTLNITSIILSAAGLGFLGLGAQPPSPEWGAMLSSARQFILSHGHIAAAPGIMILLTSLAFNLVGDGLRDVLNPRQE